MSNGFAESRARAFAALDLWQREVETTIETATADELPRLREELARIMVARDMLTPKRRGQNGDLAV